MDLSKLPAVTESLIQKHESLLSKIFGAPIRELEETLADQIKYRRFQNQVRIFAKANDLLKKNNINAKPIALKHLTTLIDLSSVEEDPKIQEKWANIIANLASYDSMEMFNKNCINLLGILSAQEIAILDHMNDEFIMEAGELIDRREQSLVILNKDIATTDVVFDPYELGHEFGIPEPIMKLYIENLIALGLLIFEDIELEEQELVQSNNVHLSYLGLYFVRLGKYR
jgi:hypothetical protein